MAYALPLSQTDDFATVEALVESETMLKLSVVDLFEDEETLVTLVTPAAPRKFVRHVLSQAWSGPVEVHCASDIMAGAL